MVAGLLKAIYTEGTAREVINLGNLDERSITNFAEVVLNIVNPNVEED
ncbi:hypothetical protein [Candidatus Chlorohelix sp.]